MHTITLPKCTQTMEEAKVISWFRAEGEEIRAGEPVVEIETDKAAIEIESEISGVLRKILVHAGESVTVGTVLAYVGEPNERIPVAEEPDKISRTPIKGSESISDDPKGCIDTVSKGKRRSIRVSPRAKRLASTYGIDVGSITGSGPRGYIREGDVQKLLAADAHLEPRPISSGQLEVGKVLQESIRNAPHFYVSINVNMSDSLRLRTQISDSGRISITDFVVKAVGMALQQHREMNCRWKGEELVYNRSVNVGIAVDVGGDLLVATISDVNRKLLSQVAIERERAVGRAREGKVGYHPASLTISNLGMFGVHQFTAIINPPEVSALAVGEVVSISGASGRPQQRAGGQQMTLTLSCDHRAVNGVLAARFLGSVRGYLEDATAWADDLKKRGLTHGN